MSEASSMDRRVGRVRRKLARLLQASFPEAAGGLTLTWEAEQLYPATGSYRTNATLDCMRWEGFARHYRPDGTFFTVWNVGSYIPMSELIRASRLTISESGEVYPLPPNTPAETRQAAQENKL